MYISYKLNTGVVKANMGGGSAYKYNYFARLVYVVHAGIQ